MSVYHSDNCGETRAYHYRYIRSHKIRFSVKAERDVAVSLSSEDHDNSNMYEIFIGCWGGGESGIRRGKEEDVVRVETPDILNPCEFTSFWITVRKGVVKVGKKGKIRPFMMFEDSSRLEDMRYYGFSTGWGAEGDWMFNDENEDYSSSSCGASSSDSEAEELDALEERPIMYKRPAYWVFGAGGYMPRHPVCAGEGSKGKVYVGMAHHEGGHILGMVVPRENKCYVPFAGKAWPKEEYYVLGNPSNVELVWEWACGGAAPTGALEAGFSENKEPFYVGRVCMNGGVVACGKVHPSHGGCFVPHHGREHGHQQYEVLCVKKIPVGFRCKTQHKKDRKKTGKQHGIQLRSKN